MNENNSRPPLYPSQITNGYFSWTDGTSTLSNVNIKIPFGEYY